MAPEGPNCSIIKDIWDEFAAGGKVIAVFMALTRHASTMKLLSPISALRHSQDVHNCNIPVYWLILLCDFYFFTSHLVTDLPGLFCHSHTLTNKHVTFSLVLDNMALDLMWYVIVFNIISWSVSLYINRWFGSEMYERTKRGVITHPN